MEYISIKTFVDVVCGLIPAEILKSKDRRIYGKKVTFRDRFIRYCEVNWKYPKYSVDDSRKKALKILEDNDFLKDKKIDFSIFDVLLGECFPSE